MIRSKHQGGIANDEPGIEISIVGFDHVAHFGVPRNEPGSGAPDALE